MRANKKLKKMKNFGVKSEIRAIIRVITKNLDDYDEKNTWKSVTSI